MVFDTSTEKPEKPSRFGARHWQAIQMFLGMMINYFQRVNISAGIVPMTTPTADAPYYEWDLSQKSLILSSFFWGYVVSQVPAGLLAKRFGAKYVICLATAVGGIMCFFHPMAANGGYINICVLRVLTGLVQGCVYPCFHTLLSKWVPRTERGFLTTGVYSGAQFGTAVILVSSGNIFESSMGWPGLFYISGGLGLAWALLFFWQGADEPATSSSISKLERDYIESLTGSNTSSQSLAIPWKDIFTSGAFYGLLAAHCGFTWGFYTLLTEMPTYMSSVLKLDVKSNAVLSSLPYFAMGILCFVVSPISDLLINRGTISVTTARKLFNSIGQWVPMACLIGLGYMTADEKTGAIVLLTLAVGINAACFCGYLVNHMDLSPNFAGPMMGVTNGLAGVTSIIAPLIVGVVLSNEEDPTQWRLVFFITGAIYLLCNLLFVIFGKATVQPWNEPPSMSSTMTLRSNIQTDSRTTAPTPGKENQF
ncbi:putative inorganic phosphate cotransporter isoform X2 [Drosophila sulfurigaster albostrigata]|uniref:putative inorganic phosphate cotransporter isoform X2 n=1 Tax=Drosophila sulfurigaster albostrigata TaxID=89887 RepID=UPI002D21C652|nr:putative inorganic phosphate cotransporter isoform X2 [Drosophila sulfurigaster albostrigata]